MNVQRSHGMDIDAYVKHLQSSKDGGAHALLTDNTGAVDDDDDEERLITNGGNTGQQ